MKSHPVPHGFPLRALTTRVSMTVALVAVVVWVGTAPTAAQSRRAPTAAETRALTTFTDVLLPVLDQFGDANWEKTDDSFDGVDNISINVDPGVPLDNCIGFWRTYQVRPDSTLFNTRIKPLEDRVQKLGDELVSKYRAGTATKAESDALDGLNQQLEQMSQVGVDVCANSPNVDTSALRTSQPSLVAGVLAHKVSGDVCGVDVPICYVVLVGNWATAADDPSDNLSSFKFVHPAGSPYLENAVIKLTGSEERIQQLLKKIDWSRLKQGLTD